MKKLFTAILFTVLFLPVLAQHQLPKEAPEQKEERLAWWVHDRFGMFIHWGLYAQAARHEWVKTREQMTDEQYAKYFDLFNPDLFEPREWAKMAKEAGMKYAVITTKHHEGFCLFDSKFTDFKVTNTPYGKDILKEWVEAFRAEGLKIGFYYSLIDWHHPEYTIDSLHPQRPESAEEYAELNKDRDMDVYRKYLLNQVSELLTNYGKIDILWLDYSFPGKFGKGRDDWNSWDLLAMARKLQPGIIINNRLDLEEDGWDFITPEQYMLQKWPEINGRKVPWETCQTFSGSWGYYRDEYTWKTEKQLLQLLIESVSMGGNLLLNVGPTGRGVFDERAEKSLKGIGKWMKYNNRSIYGCTMVPEGFQTPTNCLLTYNPELKRLYVHLLDYPLQNLTLPGFKGKIKYAQFLHDASEIIMREPHMGGTEIKLEGNNVYLSLPVKKPDMEIPVIELILEN